MIFAECKCENFSVGKASGFKKCTFLLFSLFLVCWLSSTFFRDQHSANATFFIIENAKQFYILFGIFSIVLLWCLIFRSSAKQNCTLGHLFFQYKVSSSSFIINTLIHFSLFFSDISHLSCTYM